MNLHVVHDIREVEEYGVDWDSILEEGNNSNPYLTREWAMHWWSFFGENRGFYLLRMEDSGKTLGLCPMMKWKGRLFQHYHFVGWPQSSRMSFIVWKGYEEQFTALLLEHFQSLQERALVSFHGFFNGDSSHPFLLKAMEQRSHLVISRRASIADMSDLGSDSFLLEIRKHRTIRKVLNRETSLKKICTLRYEQALGSDIDSIFPLHERRWQKKFDTNGFAKGRQREFWSHMAKIEGPLPWQIQVFLLKVGELPIAFHYSILCNGRAYGCRIAHDNDFALYSPGYMIALRALESFYSCGCHEVDFSTGDDLYKQCFTNKVEVLDEILFGSSSLLCEVAIWRRKFKEAIRHLMKRSPSLVRFKRVSLGRMAYILSFAPAKERIVRIRKMIDQRGVPSLILFLIGRLLVQIGVGKLVLFHKRAFERPSCCCPNISFRVLSLDDYVELKELSFLSAETVTNRYYKGGRCVLIYDREILMGYVWISQTSIKRGKRLLWEPEKYEDQCIHDVWFFRGCGVDQMKEGVIAFVKEYAPKGRANLDLLIEPFDRKLNKVADGLFLRGEK